MAWTKTKTAIAVGIAVLFTTGTAVTVKRAFSGPSWEMNLANLNSLPPTLILRPTKFPGDHMGLFNGNNAKAIQKGVALQEIVAHAYNVPVDRIVFPPGFPPLQKYFDAMLTLNDHPREAMQKEIQRQFGYVGRRETQERDILVLQLKRPDAPGLKPAANINNSASSSFGRFNVVSSPISSLADYLPRYLGKMVRDDTGLTNLYDIDIRWKTTEELKQAISDELGLELVPGHEPIEVLVVEKIK